MSPDIHKNIIKETQTTESLIQEILKARGWKIETMTKQDAGLVTLDPKSSVGCMDGRKVIGKNDEEQHAYERGPKIPGAIIGLALSLLKDGTVRGIKNACDFVISKGLRPGAHDVLEDHCGAKKLAAQNKYSDLELPVLTATAGDIQSCITETNGIIVSHGGAHEEKGLILNLDTTMTRVPDTQFFQADIRWLIQMGVDPREAINFYASTVEQLKPDAKIAYIVI